jgi:hypothetical protein
MGSAFGDIAWAARSLWALYVLVQPVSYGSIAYEYEKNSYPLALAQVWAETPDADRAIAFLQQPDPEATDTLGIDLYSGFVLKGQMRKYFAFGDALDPAYRDRMYAAMDRLTRTDPLTTPAADPRKFWENSQDDCTTRVDCRNTDNLRAMRETSVYLMAEETGNEATRLAYKARLTRYVTALQDIGMGEWDSPIYHGHTTAAYLNLYDFAQDPEVKALAETALDWLFRNAAVKYWRGTWTSPSKRAGDGGAAAFFWLYFGEASPPDDEEKDWIHALTSDYRPPTAIVDLAQRRFPRPTELRRTHPHYENWLPGQYGPAFWETLYFGHSFQLGTLAQGTGGDWEGFHLAMATDTGIATVTVDTDRPHAIAQWENLVLWQGQATPTLALPTGTSVQRQGITFLAVGNTWLAIHPWPNGFALEVGEPQSHGSFEAFQTAVVNDATLERDGAQITYRSSQGQTLALRPHPAGDLPQVWRNGRLYNWADHEHIPDWFAIAGLSP